MKKSRSLIVLAALLSAVGCGRPAGGEGTVCINPLEATVEVASLDGYIEQVEYIPLSAEDSASYVTRVRKVIPAGDRWVVLAGNLLVFDAGGRFERALGRTGRGPGEYVSLADACVDASGREVLAASMDKVLRYDVATGEFLGEIRPEGFERRLIEEISPVPGGGFALFVANPSEPGDFATDHYCISVFDSRGRAVRQLYLRQDFIVPTSMIGACQFSRSWDGGTLVRPQEGENILWRLDARGLSPECGIHFGDRNVPHRHFLDFGADAWVGFMRMWRSDYFKAPMFVHDTRRLLFFSAAGPQAVQYDFLIDRRSGKGIRWRMPADDGGRFETMYCMASDEKSLYWVYSDYGECPDSDPAMHPLHRYLREHGAPVLPEDANPVLVRVRFKL